jgi:hypothetical protein
LDKYGQFALQITLGELIEELCDVLAQEPSDQRGRRCIVPAQQRFLRIFELRKEDGGQTELLLQPGDRQARLEQSFL